MPSVEIIVGHNWTEDIRYLHGLRDVRPAGTSVNLVEIRDIIDIVVDGRNITSRVAEESIFGVMGGLMDAMLRLFEGQSRKAIVEFHCEPWELVLIPTDGGFQMSLYSVGHRRRVIAHDLAIEGAPFLEAVTSSAHSMLQDLYGISDHFASDEFVRSFNQRLERLEALEAEDLTPPNYEPFDPLGERKGGTSSPTGLSLQYTLDADYEPLRQYGGEHAFDLHALLCSGRIEAEHRGQSVVLTETYPVLCVTSLLRRIRDLLNEMEAAERGAFQSTGALDHAIFDIYARRDHWAVELGDSESEADPLRVELPAHDCLDVVLTAADMLTGDLVALNQHLELNHRLSDVIHEIRELRDWFEDFSDDNEYLETPQAYLEAQAHLSPRSASSPEPVSLPRPVRSIHRLFAESKWEFHAPRIHTSAITPTREGLIVPTDGGLTALDWREGDRRWDHRLEEDSTASSAGYELTRQLALIPRDECGIRGVELETGETRFENGEADLGAWNEVMTAADVPSENLVVALERQGRAVGISPQTGDVQWHFDAGHCRLAGATIQGPLMSALTREGMIYALNPVDGSLLWKVRLGGLAHLEPHMHQGRLYTMTHDANRSTLTIRAFYAFTGRSKWQCRWEGTLAGAPMFVDNRLVVPVDRHGEIRLRALDIEASDPELEWEMTLASAGRDEPVMMAPVASEDGGPVGLVRTDLSQLTCFGLDNGTIRWQIDPEPDTWRRRGSGAIFCIQDAVLTIGDAIELRRLDTGELLHELETPVPSPTFAAAHGSLQLVLGASCTSTDLDPRLVGLDLNHFLAALD